MLWVKLYQESSGEGEYLHLHHLQWDKGDYSFFGLGEPRFKAVGNLLLHTS